MAETLEYLVYAHISQRPIRPYFLLSRCSLANYYKIDGQHYNCYLYAKYFHGTLCTALKKQNVRCCLYYCSCISNYTATFVHYDTFAGNRGHLDIFKIMSRWVYSLWERVKDPWSFIMGSSGSSSTLRRPSL